MADLLKPSLSDLLARRRPGHTLETDLYAREDVFQADLDIIFGKHWIFVAVGPQIPDEGDYITLDVGRHPIVVLRDDDRQVRAFHNVCRHRAARICAHASGSVGNLVCPYHQWTYNLEGRLIHCDHMGEGFDKSPHSLKPVHVRDIEGLIFICLADEAPEDIEDFAQAISPYIAPHRLNDCKVAAQIDIVENGNWKLTMENNRECYHCAANHPELTISLYEQGFGYQPGPQSAEGVARFEAIIQENYARWEALGLPCAELEHLDDRITGFRTQRLPLDRSGQSQTMNTEVACKKLLGDFKDAALGGLSLWTQPNSWHHFMSDHIINFSVLPLGPQRTLLRTTWSVHKDAEEGRDYDVDRLTEVWRATNAQDSHLVEETQRGVNSGAYLQGPYSPYTEGLVEKFCSWYVQRMREHVRDAHAVA